MTPSSNGAVDPRGLDRVLADSLATPLETLRESFQELLRHLPLVGVGLVVLTLAVLLARWAGGWRRPYTRLSGNPFLQDIARQAVAAGFFVVGLLLALEVMGATSIVAAVLGTAGLAGLAIGFAFKDLVENYISGVLLSLRQPFAPNDHVVIDGEEGRVVRLTARATILITLDGNHLRLPNSRVFKATILNYTRNPSRRFVLGVGVGVDADLLEAQRLGVEVLSGIDGVLAAPAPSAVIEDLGDSSVLVRYRAWVDQDTHDFQRVRGEAIRRLKTVLEGAGIDLPEPIYRVKLLGRPELPDGPAAQPEAPAGSEPSSRAGAESEMPSLAADDELEDAIARELAEGEGNLLDSGADQE